MYMHMCAHVCTMTRKDLQAVEWELPGEITGLLYDL